MIDPLLSLMPHIQSIRKSYQLYLQNIPNLTSHHLCCDRPVQISVPATSQVFCLLPFCQSGTLLIVTAQLKLCNSSPMHGE